MSTVTVTITYPGPGNVSGNGTYTTYGHLTISPSMNYSQSSWLTDSNGTTVATGSTTTPPATYDWAFKYQGVTTGVALTENVNITATDGTSTTAQVGVTCTNP